MFGVLMYDVLFFEIPTALLVLFGISLYRYLFAKKQNKKVPGTVSEEEMKSRKTMLIVLSVMVGVFIVIVVGFMALLFMAVAFM